jgi:hypothetical protein
MRKSHVTSCVTICDSMAPKMHMLLQSIWLCTVLCMLACEMFSLHEMPVSTMHLPSLIRASAQHTLSCPVDVLGCSGHWSSASDLLLLQTKNHTYKHSFLWLYTCFIYPHHQAIVPTGSKTFTIKNQITPHILTFDYIFNSPATFKLIVQWYMACLWYPLKAVWWYNLKVPITW